MSAITYNKWKKEWASSHTPRSNIAWECCIQWMAIPSIRDGKSDKKGDINCSSKGSTSISCKNAHLHIMSFITTKFQEILLSGFSGVVLTNCFSSIFHFRQFLKFKKGVTSRKKMESKLPVDMHIYTLCPSLLQSFTKFCWAVSEELRWQEKQDWRTDWLTDWLTDRSKTLYPPQLVAWGIIKRQLLN